MTEVSVNHESEEVKVINVGDYLETEIFLTNYDVIKNIYIVCKNSINGKFGMCAIEDGTTDFWADSLEGLLSSLEQKGVSFRVLKHVEIKEV
ncbi:MAG: hypothetical protein K2M17_04205 [Bacilli bacterium]|nr:hypothetical protein [Bacilli bacterium]